MNLRRLAPSVFTCSNGILGLCAIFAAASGQPGLAILLVSLALLCDGLDGLTARALGVPSEFGVQYDTANDCVTFAAAPAAIGYFALQPSLGAWAIVPCAVYAGCAIFRLARFNASKAVADVPKKSTYDGLPSTGGAMLVMASVLALGGSAAAAYVVPVALIGGGLLMVSTIQYGVLKHVLALPRVYHVTAAVALGAVALLSWQAALCLVGIGYALHGPALTCYTKLFERPAA